MDQDSVQGPQVVSSHRRSVDIHISTVYITSEYVDIQQMNELDRENYEGGEIRRRLPRPIEVRQDSQRGLTACETDPRASAVIVLRR